MQAVDKLSVWARAAAEDERLRDVGIIAAVVATLCFLGPFDTRDDLGAMALLAYWSISIGAGYLGGRRYGAFVRSRLLRSGARKLAFLAEAAMITLCASVAVFALEAWLREPIPILYAAIILGNVAVVSLVVWGVFTLANRPTEPDGPSRAFLAFRERWPKPIRGARLLVLASEDHFVRVHTDAGAALISGRFADALEAVSDEPGCQVHRGWWVADGAPDGLDRTGGRWVLSVGDLTVPVSRRFRPNVRSRHWDRLGR